MLNLLPEKRANYSVRFQWIQMDEVQDTHVSEIEINLRRIIFCMAGLHFM
jgi:hypothetical protein